MSDFELIIHEHPQVRVIYDIDDPMLRPSPAVVFAAPHSDTAHPRLTPEEALVMAKRIMEFLETIKS